jgi:hypothetical protein
MREQIFIYILTVSLVFAFGAGFAWGLGIILRSRSERIIAICVERDIAPEKCVAIGDAIYGG